MSCFSFQNPSREEAAAFLFDPALRLALTVKPGHVVSLSAQTETNSFSEVAIFSRLGKRGCVTTLLHLRRQTKRSDFATRKLFAARNLSFIASASLSHHKMSSHSMKFPSWYSSL